jgi:sugar phosphate isomerase/epimerase
MGKFIMKKLSIGSWAYLFNQEQPTNDFHSLVHKLGHLGFQGIELGGFAPHPNPESHDTYEKRQKLRKMVADHRMEFSAYVPPLWSQPIWNTDDHTRYLADFAIHTVFADELGIKTIRVDTVGPIANVKEAGIEPKRMFDRCVKVFDLCSKLAAVTGINVAWEFEPCFPINAPSEVVAMVDAVRGLGNANFGVLFDTCNAHLCAGAGALDLLRQLKGKITHLQFADSDGTFTPYGGGMHIPLGQGLVKFDALMPELMTCGVANDWWCIDLFFWPDAWSVTGDSKRFVDKLRHKYAT